MEKKQKKIAAIIVTFNRKELLIKNIEMCLAQKRVPDKIIVIDNHSTDGTKDYIFQKLNQIQTEKLDYVYLESNIGGSGGFSFGTDYAVKNRYDYIWLMDDDGYPLNTMTLLTLLNFCVHYNLSEKAIWLNSLVCCNEDELSFGVFFNGKTVYKKSKIKQEFIAGTANPFNGTLISKELVQKVGIPRGDYFIKGDEKEYLARTLKNDIQVYTVCNSLYYHPTPRKKNESIVILGKIIENNIEAGWKEYYNMRNTCLNNRMYAIHPRCASIKFYLGRTAKILLFGSRKIETLRLCSIGFWHAQKGKAGIVYLPGNKREK